MDSNDSTEGSSSGAGLKMHPVTLAFSDPVREQDFQIAQAKAAVTIGWFGNVLVILISIWVAVNEVRFARSSNPTAVRFFGGVLAIQAVVGTLSTIIFSYLGSAAFDHRAMVRINVANVLVGNALIVYNTCADPLETVVMDEDAFFVIMAVLGLVNICMHLLAFPFWARCCIAPSFFLELVAIRIAGNHSISKLGHETEETLSMVATLTGEALGYLLQRSVRNQYIERFNESEALRIRTEQLQNEKERLDFECKMALKQVGRHAFADYPRAETSSLGTNSELAGLCSHFEAPAEATSGAEWPPLDRSPPHFANESASHSVVATGLGLRQRCLNAGTVPVPTVPTSMPVLNVERAEALWKTLEDAGIELRGGSDRDSMSSSGVESDRL